MNSIDFVNAFRTGGYSFGKGHSSKRDLGGKALEDPCFVQRGSN